MGMWSDRYLELAAARTQVVCRLHALLCELVPGGYPGVSARPMRRSRCSRRSTRPARPITPAWPWPGSYWET